MNCLTKGNRLAEMLSADEAHIDDAGVFGSSGFCDVASDWESRITKLLIILHVITPGDRHVVHDPAINRQRRIDLNWEG